MLTQTIALPRTLTQAKVLSSPAARQLCCMDAGGERVLGAHTPYTAKLILMPGEEHEEERPRPSTGFSYVSKWTSRKIRDGALLGVARRN